MQPDGKVVVAGTLDGGRAFAMRFLADGALDPAFADGGIARAGFSEPLAIQGIALQPDGALLLSGTVSPDADRRMGAVVRLLPSGRVDEAFGVAGMARLPDAGYSGARTDVLTVTHLGTQPDGRIVAAGSQTAYDVHSSADPYVARLMPDGALDPTFGGDGRDSIGTGDPIAVLARPTGDIVVVGTEPYAFGSSWLTLLKIDPGENTFPLHGHPYDGWASHRYRSSLSGVAAQLRADGTIDFVGRLIKFEPERRFLARVRIGPDLTVLEQHRVPKEPLSAAAFDTRGAVLTAGPFLFPTDTPPFKIERYRPTLRLDRSFGHRGRTAFHDDPASVVGIATQGDRLIVAAYRHPPDDTSRGTSLMLFGLHARQDGSGPRIHVKRLPRHGCVSGTPTMLVLARDESRTTTRVSIDRHRLATSKRHRFGVELDTAAMNPGRHTLRIRSVDAAGNRRAISRTLRVCR